VNNSFSNIPGGVSHYGHAMGYEWKNILEVLFIWFLAKFNVCVKVVVYKTNHKKNQRQVNKCDYCYY